MKSVGVGRHGGGLARLGHLIGFAAQFNAGRGRPRARSRRRAARTARRGSPGGTRLPRRGRATSGRGSRLRSRPRPPAWVRLMRCASIASSPPSGSCSWAQSPCGQSPASPMVDAEAGVAFRRRSACVFGRPTRLLMPSGRRNHSNAPLVPMRDSPVMRAGAPMVLREARASIATFRSVGQVIFLLARG